jgi:hypothetical protein
MWLTTSQASPPVSSALTNVRVNVNSLAAVDSQVRISSAPWYSR